jgi:hypothetical protein
MWNRKGILFDVNKYKNFGITSHASIPFAFNMHDDKFRIFFSSRNEFGKSLPYYIDVNVSNGNIDIIGDISGPILQFGDIGTFDDSGIMPSSLLKVGDKIYMYYIGWNEQVSVSYRLSIGLAISEDNGNTFYKYSKGPILDRSLIEPYFNTAPYVIFDDNIFKMWYVSCTEWILHENKSEPIYCIKYCTSKNGIDWIKNDDICIGYDDAIHSIGRPCVIKNNELYEIYFSHRKSTDYRFNKKNTYKIGSSESNDGINFFNKKMNILNPDEIEWDGIMNEYCHVFIHKDLKYMIYNGNGFGKDGFGYATFIG